MGFFDSVFKIGKDIVGGLGKTVLDLGGSFLSDDLIGDPNSAEAYQRSRAAADHSFKQSMQAYGSRYQMTMADMKKAGLNPILAASSGFKVGNSPQMSSAQAFMTPPAYNTGSAGVRNLMEAEKLKSEEKRNLADTQKIIGETVLNLKRVNQTIANTLKIRSEKKLIDQNEKNAVRQMFNLEQDFLLKSKEISKKIAEIYELQRRADLQHQDMILVEQKQKMVRNQTVLIRKQAKELQYRLAQLKKIAKVYDGPAGQTLSYVNEIMKSLNLNFGLIGGLKK